MAGTLRIAHVISYFQPALGYQETYIAREQIKEGHEVVVITSDRYSPFGGHYDKYLSVLGPRIVGPGRRTEMGIDTIRLPVWFEQRSRVALNGLKSTLADYRPHVVICHNVLQPVAHQVARASRRLAPTTRLIYDDHTIPGRHGKGRGAESLLRLYRQLALPSIIKSADKIVAVTASTAEYLTELGVPAGLIDVVPLGVDVEAFHFDQSARTRLRSDLGIAESDVLGIYTGKLTEEKGIRELSIALEHLLPRFPELHFLFLGYYDELFVTETVGRLPSGSVHLLPGVPPAELAAWYSAADFGIWPKGGTIAHFEAMACRLPILVANYPEARERVSYGNGEVVEQCTPQDIIKRCLPLIEDEARRLELGLHGERAARERYSWSGISRRFLTPIP